MAGRIEGAQTGNFSPSARLYKAGLGRKIVVLVVVAQPPRRLTSRPVRPATHMTRDPQVERPPTRATCANNAPLSPRRPATCASASPTTTLTLIAMCRGFAILVLLSTACPTNSHPHSYRHVSGLCYSCIFAYSVPSAAVTSKLCALVPLAVHLRDFQLRGSPPIVAPSRQGLRHWRT